MFNNSELHTEILANLTKLLADELNVMSDETLKDLSNVIADNTHGIVSQCVIDLVDQLSNANPN